jgi:hypothetical protein
MQKLFEYFISKKRYGVVGDKGVANVRDTYLVPVLPGTGNQPEFMLNLGDNFIPDTRTEPMMLCVFVYRNDKDTIQRIHGTAEPNHALMMQQGVAGLAQTPGTPTPSQGAVPPTGRQSISAPAFSPTSPQGTFPQYPSPRTATPTQQPHPPPAHVAQPARQPGGMDERQRQGEVVARDVLGDLMASPTVAFLLPQAHNMTHKEWEVIRRIYEREPRAREDLPYLSTCLEKESNATQQQQQQQQQQLLQHPQPKAQVPPQPLQPPQPQHRPQPSPQLPPKPQQLPPQHPTPIRKTPIPPPPIPPAVAAGPPRQTPIPPPPIPPQATANTSPPTA